MENIFKHKKKYGQNFLKSQIIAKKIIDIFKLEGQNIIEIGPGNLVLTKNIIKQKPKKFISLEIDKEIINKNLFSNTEIINFLLNEDALKFDELKFFKKESFIIISNLPFNISSKLLIKWIKIQYASNSIKGMILMFQKEMGERILSKENSKKYGRLSIIAQSVFNVKKELFVKKNNFDPEPKVDAIVIKFTPIKKKVKINLNKLEIITKFFFNSRRKKNEKKIKKLFDLKQIKKNKLEEIYNLRPENIPKEIFYKMSNLI